MMIMKANVDLKLIRPLSFGAIITLLALLSWFKVVYAQEPIINHSAEDQFENILGIDGIENNHIVTTIQ